MINITEVKNSIICMCYTLNIFSDNGTTTTTSTPKPTLKPTDSPPDLPEVGESEKEHKSSLTIFFILLVIGKI